MLPTPPSFSPEEWTRFRESGDWLRPAFEGLRYVGLLSVSINSIGPDRPNTIERRSREYAVVRGLIHRCARLMLADLKLAAEKKHGEVMPALTRCICESAITARWLMVSEEPDRFERYIAGGLSSDLRLKDQIQARIAERGGEILVVEERMLRSIDRCIELAGMSETDVRSTKKMYDFATICRNLQLSPEAYVAIQRLGSHAIHGSWTDLVFHYLEENGKGGFEVRDSPVGPEVNHLVAVSLEVLSTLEEYLKFAVSREDIRTMLADVCHQAKEGILAVFRASVEGDYEPA